MAEKRYKATRSFFYTTAAGEQRLAQAGTVVQDASEGKIAALVADGLIGETRSAKTKEE